MRGIWNFSALCWGRDAAAQAVRAGAGAIYHGCVHNLLHTESTAILRELYKAALFVLRARVAAEGGPWCPGSRALEERVAGPDREILRRRQALRAGRDLTEGGPCPLERDADGLGGGAAAELSRRRRGGAK